MGYFHKHYHQPGTAPGTLVAAGKAAPSPPSIRLTDYTGDDVEEVTLSAARECAPYLDRDSKTWIQINGPVDTETLSTLGEMVDLHDLALEDVLNTGQRPKMELYDDHLFITMVLPVYSEGRLETAQVSLFVGERYLIGFCPLHQDVFEPIRRRMHKPNNRRFLSRDIDYLLYAIADLVIDAAFPVLEQFGDDLEDLEDEVLSRPDQQTLGDIHKIKRELLILRRLLWPQREMINSLMRAEEPLIKPETMVYLRDCHDHAIQIIELLESFRDIATGLLDIYLSSIGNRTNETMRVLTIIATIFIPLTFIVGVYGMNFQNADSPWAMPELHWAYGYPMVWALMIVITIGLIWFFRRRRWL